MPNWVDPCPNCPRRYRAIGGDGPQPAPILCIAERPGPDENRNGRVLCGKTGQEWDELYLPLAGLDRSEVRACNTVMCWAESNKKPSDKEVTGCAAHHLPQEIERTNSNVIILMGATACKLVSGIRLELHHGIPQHTDKVGELFGWSGWLVPMYHPSIGLHESRWMQICMEDWEGLKDYLDPVNYFPDDPVPEATDYQLFGSGLHPWCPWINNGYPPAVDTESHAGQPWSVQVSGRPGTGTLFRCDNDIVEFLRTTLSYIPEIILHNAAHDLEVLRRLGIKVNRYRDTMQEAFHLGNLPQGLKPLTYRLFRHTMTSYEEVVWPASIRALQDWMLEAVQIATLDLSFVERVQLKTKIKEVAHKGELESLLRRLLRNASAESEYNPWGDPDEPRLDSFWSDSLNEWMVNHVECRIGHYPVLGIANCTTQEAIAYAVGDADWTGRVAVELARRRENAFEIYEGDRDN